MRVVVAILFICIASSALACDISDKVTINGNEILIDRCIKDLVLMLNKMGVVTTNSCCGHGRTDGWILTTDYLLIISKERGSEAHGRYFGQFSDIGERNSLRGRP